MTMQAQEKGVPGFVYAIGAFVAGAVCGVLLAPKKGSELIVDIADWGRDAKESGRKLVAQAKEYMPHREKQESGT